MNNHGYPRYYLDLTPLLETPDIALLANRLTSDKSIVSKKNLDKFCKKLCSCWQEEVSVSNPYSEILFNDRRKDFSSFSESAIGDYSMFSTAWGGVIVTRYIPPYVEKYLIVDPGCYIPLEKHSEKVEILTVREGRGALLKRQLTGENNNVLEVIEISHGSTHYFTPGLEHCVVSTEGLVIYEQSIDPRGMDKDLILIYSS